MINKVERETDQREKSPAQAPAEACTEKRKNAKKE